MKALLLKDIIVQKATIVVAGLISLVFFLGISIIGDDADLPSTSFAYVISGAVAGWMMLAGSLRASENGADRFFFSLPVSRLQGIAEKFVLLALGGAWGAAAAGGIGFLFSLAVPSIVAMGAGDAVAVFCVLGFLSIVVPFQLQFGQKGLRYLLFVLMGIGVVLQVVMLVVLGQGRNAGRAFAAVIDTIGALFEMNLAERLPGIGVIAAAAAVCCASFAVSVLLFRRKEL